MSGRQPELPPIPFALEADVGWLREALKGHRQELALERLITCLSLQQLALETARRTELDHIAGDSTELAEAIAEIDPPPTTKELLEMPRAELERRLGRHLTTPDRLGPHRREAEPALAASPHFDDESYAEPRCPERDCVLEESHAGEHSFRCAGEFCRGFSYRASERGHPVFCATGTETILDGTSMEDVAAAALDAHRAAMPPLPKDYEPFPGIKCDNCDRPATQVARDCLERFDPTASIQEFDPGPNKYGCQDHPVASKMVETTDADMMAAIGAMGDSGDRKAALVSSEGTTLIEADVAEMKAALERDEIDPESLRTASLDGVSMAALEANGEMLALSGEVDAKLLDAAHPDHRTYPDLDGPFGECDWGGCDEPAVEWRPAPGAPDQRLPVCAGHTARAEAAAAEAEADPDPADTADLEELS